MDLDLFVAENVGEFGLWQKLIFVAVGLVILPATPVIPLFPSYEPEFRCQVPACELEVNPAFLVPDGVNVPGQSQVQTQIEAGEGPMYEYDNQAIFEYALPKSDVNAVGANRCFMYDYVGNGSTCTAGDFNRDRVVECYTSVYNPSVFSDSLAEAFDIGPCSDSKPGWVFEHVFGHLTLAEMIFWIGVIIGSSYFGWISDALGGCGCIVFSSVMTSFICCLTGFSSSYWFYVGGSFFAGLMSMSGHSVAFVYASETLGKEHMGILPLLWLFKFIGSFGYGIVAYWFRDWRAIWWYAALVYSLSIPIWLTLTQSPRWLLTKGKFNKAKEALSVASKINSHFNRGLIDSEEFEELKQFYIEKKLITATHADDSSHLEEKTAAVILFKYTIGIYILYFTTQMSYLGLLRFSLNLNNDLFANFFLMCGAEGVSVIFNYVLIERLGRKPLLILGQILAFVFLLAAAFCTDVDSLLVLSFIGNVAIGMTVQASYIYATEVFPTNIRNTALGTSMSVGKLGTLASVWIVNNPDISNHKVLLSFALFNLISVALVVLLLPTVKGVPLPDTVEDILILEKNKNPVLKWLQRKFGNGAGSPRLYARRMSRIDRAD